ncbi:hypothetical protein EV356DRAFT_447756 [Viridothelium virens]|uniref:Zn(2)-C6 fungal-type domain-containing protein n=1 Tax=Viridothelium virens TaxID=1048519 RepID=A0A6A6H701_VIRVR|nr:hypothetical protein EV356DRAFT_447756 [Viridothelium virens]
MSVSCELCKQRKVKCDRGQPSCGWCVRNNQICEYRERKKPGLRAGYGRELEARLDRLEEILQTQQSAITQLTNNAINGGAAPTATSHEQPVFKSPPPPLPQTPHVPRPETALFLQKPSTFPTQPSPIEYGNVFNGNTTQPNGFQQLPSVSEGLRPPSLPGLPPTPRELYTPGQPPVPSLGSPTLNVPGAAPGVHNDHSTVQDEKLPSYDLLYALVDLYFRHINTWCPILHRRSTLDSLFGGSALDEADRILLHAIVATTLRFSTDERLTPESRVRYHSLSKQKVLLYGLENSSVKALQALVILALDLVGASNGPPGWNLLALITRSVVQLGLAVEATSASVSPNYPSIYTIRAMVLPEAKDFIEDESRRRLFWMVYILDRYATIATAFEFALDEKEIDRKLPCRDDLFGKNQAVETRWFKTEERSRPDERPELTLNKPENLGAFSHYVEIIGIMSRIHLFLKKPVDIGALADVEQWQKEYRALDSLINDWKYSLPTEFGNSSRLLNPPSNNKAINCGWIMLHATYHTTVIRLHSSAAYPTTRSPIFTPSYSASQRCLTAVEEIASLCNYVKSNALLPKLGPPFAFSVWVAARLLLVHGSTIEHQVNSSIHLFVDTLRDMGGFWHVAERYAALLQRVLEEYRESESGPPGANGERETPSTVRILADMRRCAYDLDWLISRQPKQQQQQQQQHTAARLASATPAARTPAPNELEYLDVFDFFNMPRLPAQTDGPMANGSGSGVENVATEAGAIANEFNITNFMVDVNSDWFMKNPA